MNRDSVVIGICGNVYNWLSIACFQLLASLPYMSNVQTSDSYMDYDGNELYAARWWSMFPFARENALSSQLEMGAVYFLIMFFIAMIAFVSAVMVIGLKILGTLWQDNESYRKAVFLGLKEKSLNKLISKQISLIYYYPTFPRLCR